MHQPFKGADAVPDAFYQPLAHFNVRRIASGFTSTQWQADVVTELGWRGAVGDFPEAVRWATVSLLPAHTSGTDAIIQWFRRLTTDGQEGLVC